MYYSDSKIMLIEDDLISQNIYKQILENLFYENITVFESGKEALQQLDNSFDLIIMDYYLNDINGRYLFDSIKTKCPTIPIVVASAQEDMVVAINFLKNGAFDYLLKGDKDKEHITEIMYKFEQFKSFAKLNQGKDQMNNTRLASLIIQTEENIRREIANELHDNIVQLIFSSKLYIDTEIRAASKKSNYLVTAKEQLNIAIDELRKLSKRLHFSKENTYDLKNEVEKIVDTLKVNQHIEVIYTISLKDSNHYILNKTKNNVYRILQEISNNCLKYSNATKIILKVEETQENLIIKFSDNGVGFDINKIKKGLGLQNIINRIKSENGDYVLNAQKTKGCHWHIAIPFNT